MKRVLVVDDLATNRMVFCELLEPLGWVCTEAENGVQGLAMARDLKPDLILSDYEMPKMDGLKLLESLKNDPSTREIPVILITAHSTADIRAQALNIGAATVFPKPFEFEALFKAVATLVDGKPSQAAVAAPSVRAMEILLVEDNEGDVRLTQEALKEVNIQAHLSVVNDGEEAMAFLRREGLHTDTVRPDLILLDLNLPKKSGHEVLAEVKVDEHLQSIPVVVLSSSAHEEDVLKAHERFANCYVTKPVEMSEFWSVIKNIVEFWLIVAKIPQKH